MYLRFHYLNIDPTKTVRFPSIIEWSYHSSGSIETGSTSYGLYFVAINIIIILLFNFFRTGITFFSPRCHSPSRSDAIDGPAKEKTRKKSKTETETRNMQQELLLE